MIRLGRTALALGLSAFLSLSACGDDDGGGNSTPNFDFSAFDAEVEAFIDEQGLDGVGAILVHRDYGVIHQRSFGSFTDERVYLIASSSKMLSAGVLMSLADQGILDMDEPIVDAVGWGDDNPTITPAQLVSNSSGLVGLLPNPTYMPYLCQYIFSGTLQDCAERIFTTEEDDADVIAPDTTFRYGGAQWQVAGAVAEIVSGKSWADLIREIYVEPCGLEALAYNNHFAQITGPSAFEYPDGFDGDPGSLQPSDNPNIEGGAYTTIGDYGKLLLMHLRDGLCGDNRVLSAAAVRRMHADRIDMAYAGSAGNDDTGYGLGWWIDRTNESLITDPGAYGAFPWLDEQRGIAGFLVVEETTAVGRLLFNQVYPIVNQAVDAAG